MPQATEVDMLDRTFALARAQERIIIGWTLEADTANIIPQFC
jgi:hypothetical protein